MREEFEAADKGIAMVERGIEVVERGIGGLA